MSNKKTKIIVKPNGPLIIDGNFEIAYENGEIKEETRLVICRCGASGKMPFCDASHNRIGFVS